MFQNACIGVLSDGSWHEDTAVAGPHRPDCHFSLNINYKQAFGNICGSYSLTQTSEHMCLYKQFSSKNGPTFHTNQGQDD